MSLNMLIETPGGFDYTGADCRAWMQEAGFRTATSSISLGPTPWSSGSSRRSSHTADGVGPPEDSGVLPVAVVRSTQ